MDEHRRALRAWLSNEDGITPEFIDHLVAVIQDTDPVQLLELAAMLDTDLQATALGYVEALAALGELYDALQRFWSFSDSHNHFALQAAALKARRVLHAGRALPTAEAK